MKKLPKRIWICILSGFAIILGGCSEASCLYGPPKVYGPPPPETETDTLSGADTTLTEIRNN